MNLQAVKLAVREKIPLIIEKPISDSFKNAEELKNIAKLNQMIILPNLSNSFTDTFLYLKNFISKNILEIQRIVIIEGNKGPFRNNIHPIWDWGFHSFSTLINILKIILFQKFLLKKSKKFTHLKRELSRALILV